MAPALINRRDSTNVPFTVKPDAYAQLSKYGNPALFVDQNHKLELQNSEIPRPAPTEALVHVRCSGICGSDMHLWKTGAIGPIAVDRQCVLGHEAAGVVLAVGAAVAHLKAGDRVAIEPGVPCRNCWLCDLGKYNLCEDVKFAGVCPYAGSIRRFMTHEAKYLHKIPDSMSFAQGALLEPLAVILHAIEQCGKGLGIGKATLICGAGPIGIIALAAAKASGSWPLAITDMDEQRLAFATKFCPGVKTYKVDPKKSSMQASEEIRALFNCEPRDLVKMTPSPNEYRAPLTVLECTGVESSVTTAIYTCRRNGTVMVVGVGKSIMNNLPFMQLSLSEIDLLFTNRYADNWPQGINALANGQVLDLDALVTHTFPLEKAVEAMEACADKSNGSVKIHIVDDTEITLDLD